MKKILILVIACTVSTYVLAQREYEPSTLNPFGLPNPAASSEIKDYQELIGLCDCISTTRKQDGTWAESVKMTWKFKYIMNGMAVQDQTLKEDGAHAGSIRQYLADSSNWYVHYISSAKPAPKLGTWKGGKKGNDIVLYRRQKAPNGMEGSYKIVFYDITDSGFNWLGAWVNLDESINYPTWKIECKKRIQMKNILGLRTTIYKVGDLNEAKEWYAKAFSTKPYFDEPFYVGFNIGGYELGLLPEEQPSADKEASVLSYWGVNEIEKTYNHLIMNGATEHEKPHSVGDPIVVASVKDPWGNIIGLIYNPVFKLEE